MSSIMIGVIILKYDLLTVFPMYHIGLFVGSPTSNNIFELSSMIISNTRITPEHHYDFLRDFEHVKCVLYILYLVFHSVPK